MPYIPEENREKFEEVFAALALGSRIDNVGELNYLITKICEIYMLEHGESYSKHNDILGVLECVKQEWYRRKVTPYEEKKLKSNGDIFEDK